MGLKQKRPGSLRRFVCDDAGGIAIMSAVFMTCAIACAAIAVDLSHLWFAKRQAQASADLAAIAAVRSPGDADHVVRATVAGNGVADATEIVLEWGSYRRDATLAPQDRFELHAGATYGDAARVSVRRAVPLFFGRALYKDGSVPIIARGVASRLDQAGITLGSKLLSLHGGVLNALLSALTGSTVSLDAVHYDALAMANVDLLSGLDALNTQADLDAVTYDDVLNADVSAGDLAGAMADVASLSEAEAALDLLGSQLYGADLSLGDIIDLGPLGSLPVGTGANMLSVSAGDLMAAALGVANGTNQIALDLGASLSGLADVTVNMAVGERPQGLHWLSVGPQDVIVRTAQVRLGVEAELLGGESGLGAVLKSLLGLGGLVSVDPVRLPLVVEVAAAEARVAGVSCDAADPSSTEVDVEVRPAVAEAWIGDVDTSSFADFDDRLEVEPAKLTGLRALLFKAGIHASSYVGMGDPEPRTVTFTADEAGTGIPKTVTSTGLTESLIDSLTEELELEVTPGGIGGALGGLLSAVGDLLEPVAAVLDSLVDSLLAAVGVKLGAADVRLEYVACGDARLVM